MTPTVQVKWTRKRPWQILVPDKIERFTNGYKLTFDAAAIHMYAKIKHRIEWLVSENGQEYACFTRALDINGTEAQVWIEYGFST